MKALSEKHAFGILQIDAHMDLRKDYEGFTFSHASIMRNAIQLDGVQSIVQVGIRDYCEEEETFIRACDKPIQSFYDDNIKEGLMIGDDWTDWVHSIIALLPEKVYISFDIDGLQPGLCPGTGTPVPGGLSFEQASFLIRKVAQSGRRIIGFDLCEVAPGAWDGNVAARMLYRLITYTGVSHRAITFRL
jgi:agmatinase